jgi:cytochrome c553
MKTMRLQGTLLLCAAALFGAAAAAAQDMEKGREINGVCAGCHGELGQGGKKGEYPRLAGQSARYLEEQLRSFRSRGRINLPMYPYTEERELPDEDIRAIAGYLASIELPTALPVFRGDEDALTRLQAVDKVMILPRAEGDVEHGGKVFEKECADCHGRDGRGHGRNPSLVGQYTNYLAKQIGAFLKGARPHDGDADNPPSLTGLAETDIRDVLAYLTAIQEPGR